MKALPTVPIRVLKALFTGCIVVLSAVGGAQTKTPQVSAANCHIRLAALDRDYDFFASKPSEELGRIRKILEDCLNDSYDGLTKRELAVAGIELEWVQYLIDQAPDQEVGEQPPPEDPTPKSGKVRVAPLEIGSEFTFLLGSAARTCTTSSVEEMGCSSKTSGYDIFIGAIVTQKSQRYLIGCRQYDSTCIRPQYGVSTAVVEGKTLRFLDWGVVTTDRKTGRTLDRAPAIFTILAHLE